MESDLDRMKFPVVAVNRNGFIDSMKDRETLETCSKPAWQSGYYSGLLLIDSKGHCWEVIRAETVGYVPPFAGWRLFMQRQIYVRLEVKALAPLDLQGMKERLCQAIEQCPEQWEAAEDISETKARVMGATNIPELIQMFQWEDL